MPTDAVPSMKFDKSKGVSFRVANGGAIPNLGSTKLKGNVTLGRSPLQIGTLVAEVTKPLALVDEMVAGGIMVIMHRSGGMAKRLDSNSEEDSRYSQASERKRDCTRKVRWGPSLSKLMRNHKGRSSVH